DPRKRYDSSRALADDLHRFLAHEPIRARPIGWAERALKWAQRKPWAAALVAVSTLGTLGLMTILTVSLGVIHNEQQITEAALKDKSEALHERNRAFGELQRNFQREQRKSYLQQIALAQRQWQASNVAQADRYLQQCVPGPGQPDLRGWEWNYLRRIC